MKMDITKCLTVSSVHVTQETIELLSQEAQSKTLDYPLCLSVYEKAEYGFWIHVPREDRAFAPSLPADLKACLMLAREHDCQWLCLDRDGEEVSMLPTYDW